MKYQSLSLALRSSLEENDQIIGEWVYGCSDVEENIKFEKWYNRVIYSIKNEILDFKIWGFKKHDDTDLPFRREKYVRNKCNYYG